MSHFDPWRDLPAAFGGPVGQGRIREQPSDFVVVEQLGFEPNGEGEHLLLRLRETGCNTEWVAGRLARWAGRPRRDVGFAGLKDRHAVTEQWFSIHCPGGRFPKPETLDIPGVELLVAVPHQRKLRRGALRGNQFRLRVTALTARPDQLGPRLGQLAQHGVPNAFGPQRFGHASGNLACAADWFGGGPAPRRPARGFALSAARALIFNAVLAERIRAGDWQTARAGDPVQLDGSGSWFIAAADDSSLAPRLAALDVHPTGPLWGRGPPAGDGPGTALERTVASRFGLFAEGLAAAGLEQQRRALRARVHELEWHVDGDVLELSFGLPAGSYATVLLREVLDFEPDRGAAP